MPVEFHLGAVMNAAVFAVLGVIILICSFILMDKLTPYDLWREIVEKQNMALAVLAGLMALGTAIIIAAAVH